MKMVCMKGVIMKHAKIEKKDNIQHSKQNKVCIRYMDDMETIISILVSNEYIVKVYKDDEGYVITYE